MANEWAEQKLPTGTDGKERPALWDPAKGDKGEWVPAQGRDGRQWVRDDSVESQLKKLNETVGSKDNKSRIVDGNGNSLFTVERPGNVQDEDVKAELESIKSTQAEILYRLDGTFDTNVTGSNVEDEDAVPTKKITRQEIEILMDSVVINAKSASGNVYMRPNGASEIYLFVQTDQQPWSLDYRNQFGSVSSVNGYPDLKNVEKTYNRARPAISFPLGYNPEQGIPAPSNIKEAKDWGLPITSSEYFRLQNNSDEEATVTVNVLRIWR